MKDRSSQALENIYEMWMRFQSLSENGETSMEGAVSDSAAAPTMALPTPQNRVVRQSYLGPIAITQYFLTICIKPTSEVLGMLPDELFINC